MKIKTLEFILLIGLIQILISSENSSAQNISKITSKDTLIIKLNDNEKALINPGMGWNMIYYTFDDVATVPDNQMGNLVNLLNEIPCGIVSNRVSWKKMEPNEGQYNWELLDTIIRPLVDVGNRVAFKWYTNFLWDNADRQSTPLWVKEAGAQGHYLDMDGKHENDTWIAHYGDPVLLEKLDNFYKAAAEHYKNFPIEFIELGSIGRVGEGTTWEIAIVPSYEEIKKHIDLLRAAFPNTQLIINDDYELQACLYAKSLGYGVDDHSIGVGGKSGNPDKTGRAYNKEVMDPFQDGTTTIGLEDETWFQIDNWYLKQMIESKANYCRIHQNPINLKADSIQPILKQMNLKMGYRIQFPEIKVPSKITKSKPFTINYGITNAGVGYCLKPYFPVFTILDENNKEVASSAIDHLFKTRDLKDGVTLLKEVSITIPANSTGKVFSLYISMTDKNKVPVLNLPYDKNDGRKRYFICQLSH